MILYGILGDPVSHSHSPMIHNAWIKKYKINAHYQYIPVKKGECLREILSLLPLIGYAGINVTVPYKEDVFAILPAMQKDTEIRAINTIKWIGDKCYGYNTDVYGFRTSVENHFGKSVFNGKKVLVLGAGGASLAVLHALKDMSVDETFIYNRTFENAKKLEGKFNITALQNLHYANIAHFDVIINATTVGLSGELYPIDYNQITSDQIIIDLIYNPDKTKFLLECEKRGAKIMNGYGMLIEQARKSFEIWTDILPQNT